MSSSAPGEPLEPTDQDLDVLLKNLGNLVTPMALRVAATLRLVDHLLAG